MAVTTGPRVGTTRWSANSDPQAREHFDDSHAAIEANAAVYVQNVRASRPAPGIQGRFFWATDEKFLYYDDGSAWSVIAAGLDTGWTGLALVSGYNGGGASTFRSGLLGAVRVETTKNGSPVGPGSDAITTLPVGMRPSVAITFELSVNGVGSQAVILPVGDPNEGDIVLYHPAVSVGQTIKGYSGLFPVAF